MSCVSDDDPRQRIDNFLLITDTWADGAGAPLRHDGIIKIPFFVVREGSRQLQALLAMPMVAFAEFIGAIGNRTGKCSGACALPARTAGERLHS